MKGAFFAAASLLGAVNAGIHKMPLKKIPLSEQLAMANMDTHAKHLGQKYMGIRPQSHIEEMFKDTAIHDEKDHAVPVSNFLNAQCKSSDASETLACLTTLQTSLISLSERRLKDSRSSSIPVAPTCGSLHPNAAR
jgi:hypothetical protein